MMGVMFSMSVRHGYHNIPDPEEYSTSAFLICR